MSNNTMNIYPEIREKGDLASLIQDHIARRVRDSISGEIIVQHTATFWSVAKLEDRLVSVAVASQERLFMAEFWDMGVQVGSLSSPDLATVAGGLLAFLADRTPAIAMTNSIPEFAPTPQARPHEDGAMAEVAFQWEEVKRTLEAETPELLSLADTLSRTWPFSHLFPTVSLEALCFSRCTGTPYSGDCPSVVWLSPGHYEVRTRGGNEPVGGGDEATALNLLQAALPPGCGPAVQGSAETLS